MNSPGRVLIITLAVAAHIGLLQLASAIPPATPPTLTKIDPAVRTDLTKNTVTVTFTGTGFTDNTSVQWAPVGAIKSVTNWVQTSGVSATAMLTLADVDPPIPSVNIWVQNPDGTTSGMLPFQTGVASVVCLETLQSGECSLRWEVDATSATGSSSQSNNSTTPNILVKLDYQWHSPKDQNQKALLQKLRQVRGLPADHKLDPSKLDHLAVHADFKTGYTQVVTATKVQPTSASGTAGTSPTCPAGSAISGSMCTTAIPQQAFIAEAAAKVGWAVGVDGQGTFAEFGVGGRGSFQYLIPTNKIVQSSGTTFTDLSAFNPQSAVGFYEATGHFKLSQIGHDRTTRSGGTQNTSNLLVFEAGYQNNRGLQQLAANPMTNTRNRYVARFYVNPEIIKSNHTQLTMGMEYSGGIDGGPHVVQLFFGTNLNPAKLFKPQ